MEKLFVIIGFLLFALQPYDKSDNSLKNVEPAYVTKDYVDSIFSSLNGRMRRLEMSKAPKSYDPPSILGKFSIRASDKRVDRLMFEALATYNGPSCTITSMRRLSNPASKHFSGKAVDIKITDELIEYLTSDDGRKWLAMYGLDFYIEDNRKSSRLRRYLDNPLTRPHCKVIPWASGLHVHLYLKN